MTDDTKPKGTKDDVKMEQEKPEPKTETEAPKAETPVEDTVQDVDEEPVEEKKPIPMPEPKLNTIPEKPEPETKVAKLPDIKPLQEEVEEVEEKKDKEKPKSEDAPAEEKGSGEIKKDEPLIFALRTTANREDQVMDFLSSNITKKGLNVFSVTRPHGMRGYIFIEAASQIEAEQAAHGIPYARGILPKAIDYSEMEHMVEPVKRELTIRKNDIVEIISGPFKRETAKITRIDEQKEEVVVELVEAAVPIPITLKIDSVKVIRRDTDDPEE
ncbi:transcription elongation factor Spt5 [Nanoarchaeota archaeon]